MRVFASILAVSFVAAFAVAPAAARPMRVASLNLCTDELVLMLAAPGQLVSVTHLAQDPAESPLWREARRVLRNDGTLESVVTLRPDLVVTMGGGSRDRVGIAARLGMRTLVLPFARSLADVRTAILRLAAALGRPAAGAALLRRLDRLRSTTPARRIDALWLGGGGRTVAPDGIEAQWMALAGLSQRSVRGDRVSLETLLVHPPSVVLHSDYRSGDYSSAQRWHSHPVARRARGSRRVRTDGRLWTCMGPLLVDEILRLRRALGR